MIIDVSYDYGSGSGNVYDENGNLVFNLREVDVSESIDLTNLLY